MHTQMASCGFGTVIAGYNWMQPQKLPCRMHVVACQRMRQNNVLNNDRAGGCGRTMCCIMTELTLTNELISHDE